MKNLTLLLILSLFSCNTLILPDTDTVESFAPCIELSVGDDICQAVPQCPASLGWIRIPDPAYLHDRMNFDLAMNLVERNNFNQTDQWYSVSLGGPCCPIAAVANNMVDYVGYSTFKNVHTNQSPLRIGAIEPHAVGIDNRVIYAGDGCIDEAEVPYHAHEIASAMGMRVASHSVAYNVGAIKFKLQRDGASLLPVNIHYAR